MIITFLNLKGGAGKTTLSTHLASTLSLAGKRVLLIDADVQNSALHWAESREEEPLFPVMGMPTNTLHKQIKFLESDYDFIIIDGPPRASDIAKSCIVAADFIFIPVNPSPYDIWASSEIVNILDELKEPLSGFKKIRAAFIINRVITGTVIGRDVYEALEQYKLPILKHSISQRVSYAETATRGTTVIEEDPDSKAGKEFKTLVEEIIEFINTKENK
jgi:chromosome partitioning protein